MLQIIQMDDDPSLDETEQIQRKVNIFMQRVVTFYNTTQQHAHRHKLDSKNRFSISTLLRPPQLYQFAGNPKRSGPHYNRLLDEINAAIVNFNQEVRTEHKEILGGEGKNPVVPGMDMWGLRRNSRGKTQHVFNHFREKQEEIMLHLVEQKQARAVARVVKFFKLCTPNPLGQYLDTRLQRRQDPAGTAATGEVENIVNHDEGGPSDNNVPVEMENIGNLGENGQQAVSYTHLTLPTKA